MKQRLGGRLIVFAATVSLIGGCGLPDYQKRMDAQRARIQAFDETSSLLDEPIDLPKMAFLGSKDEKPAWLFDVYLRLPKGYGATPKGGPYFENFAFLRYADSDPAYGIFLWAALVAESDKDGAVGKYTKSTFRTHVTLMIRHYYFKTHKQDLIMPKKLDEQFEPIKRFSPYPDDSKPIPYMAFQFSDTLNKKVPDHSTFRAYFLEEAGKQMCIVEQRPLRPANEDLDKAFRKAFAAALRTIDIGNDAASKRTQFRRAKG